MKFKVMQECDYICGHLRYGHLEGEVEVESKAKLEEMIENGNIRDYMHLVIDDYEVDDYDVDVNPIEIIEEEK